MKKFSVLFAAAVAALATFSCAREENIRDDKPEVPAIHFTVVAEETKTVVDGSENYATWEADDELKIVETLVYNTASASGLSGYQYGSAVADAAGKSVEFDATIPAGLPTDATTVTSASYIAAYPKEANLEQGGSGESKFWRVNLPAEQWPGNGTFDKAADVLLSYPVDKGTERIATGDKLDLRFHRIGTAVKMTVKGLTNGEKLKKIEVTAPIDIAGYVKVDLATGDYLNGPVSYGGNGYKTVTLKFNDLAINGDLDVWFRVLPGEWESIAIMAETDVAYYYRDADHDSAITLSESLKFVDTGRTRFAVNLGAKRVEKGNTTDFTAVTNQSQIGEGAKYIVAYVDENKADVMLPFEGTLKYLKSKSDVDVASNVISVDESEVQVVTLEAAAGENAFYVLFDGKYLSCTANNASLTLNDDKLASGADIWTVTPAGIVNTVIKNGSNVAFEIQYNSGTNPPRFANYAGTQKAITLFANGTATASLTTVELSFSDGSNTLTEVSLDPTTYDSFLGLDLVANPNVTAITSNITWSYEDDNHIIADFDSGALILNGTAGTATITASFAGDATYKPASASYTITVSDTVPVEKDWVETALADITSSDVFVIVGNNGENYAMNHASLNNNGAPTATAVSVNNNKLAAAPSVDLQWTLSYDSNGYVFYPNDGSGKWLNLTANNNGLRVSDSSSNGKYWNLDTASGYLVGTDTADATRYVGVYNSQDWRSYTSINNNIASQTFKFYKETQDTDLRTAVSIHFEDPDSGDVTSAVEYTTSNYGDFYGLDVIYDPNDNAIGNAISWSYADPNGIIDDFDSGALTLSGNAGTATVTASFAGDATYKPASASYTITVTSAAGGNDGSLAHPYTVAEALDIIAGYSNKQKSDAEVYVSGIIANVGSYNSSFHSVTYDISDDGANSNTLNIYSGKFVNNADFVSNSQVAVGDQVVVYGFLYLYNTTKEMYQNNYIYSLNGLTKALTAGSLDASTNDANKQITVTWGAASGSSQPISYVITCGDQIYNASAAGSHTFTMTAYDSYDISVVASASDAISATVTTSVALLDPGSGNDGTLDHPYTASEARALALGGDTGTYYIKGYVTSIPSQYSSQFGNARFWIADAQGSDQTFEGYNVKYFNDNAWVDGNEELAVGDLVVIYGQLTKYNNTTPETNGGYLVSLNGKGGLTIPSLTITPNSANKQITVQWGAATGSSGTVNYVISCGGQNYNATAAGSHTFTVSDYDNYTVSIVASASDVYSSFASDSVTLTDPSSSTTTVTKTMTQIVTANGYTVSSGTNATMYKSFQLDSNITVSTSGADNCGSFWGNTTQDWRLYQNKQGDITITAGNGKTLSKVTITYTVTNTGTLKSGNTVIASGAEQSVSGTSVTYTVGNTGTATNGQVRVTQISVTYK